MGFLDPVPACMGFPLPASDSVASKLSKSSLNPDIVHLETEPDPAGEGLSPTRPPPSGCCLKLACYLHFGLTGSKSDAPTTPSWALISLLEWLAELRKTHLLTKRPNYYERILKDVNQEPDEEIHAAGS